MEGTGGFGRRTAAGAGVESADRPLWESGAEAMTGGSAKPTMVERADVGGSVGPAARVAHGRLWSWGLGLAAVLMLVALLAYGLTKDPKAIPSPLVGRPAPPFALRLLSGGEFRLDAHRGQVVVVNFWASWCYPACWNEAPRLEAAWEKYRDRGVWLVGVVYQDTERGARDFIRRFNKTYPNGMDPGTRIAIDYGVYGVPETFFIDQEGRIAHKHVGEISREKLFRTIDTLLAGQALGGEERGSGWRAQ